MKNQRKTEIRVGITVVIGIILLIWILTWAKSFSLSEKEKILFVRFNNVSGLEIGDYVTINGVRKGVVEDFNIEGENVVVKMSLDDDVQLKKDAEFSIAMLDLMGGKKIDVNPGISPELLNYDEIQQGNFQADIPAVMSMLGTAQEDLFEILQDVKTALNSMNNYLDDQQLNENIKSAVSNLNDMTQEINLMIDENRENFNKLTVNTVELTEEAKGFIKENRANVKSSLEELNSLLKSTDSLAAAANVFLDEIKNKQNNLGKLMYDEEIYNNLTQTLQSVKELTKILNDQLKGEGINVDANVDLF